MLNTQVSLARIFHIRAPLPRKGGNHFYRDNAPRVAKTLCGEPVTSHDIRYSWQAFATDDFRPCCRCVEIRRNTPRSQAAYGHSAVVERRRNGQYETVTIRRKGAESAIRRAANLVGGFQRIISIEAIPTREQWLAMFGEGRM
jgi:hypothetical protein